MKLKKTQGYRLHSPLSYAFTMLELGGSYVQKYNSLTGDYTPNRELTPYQLKPQLIISDPDGAIITGDYTTRLVSAKWTVQRYINQKLQEQATYTEDADNHRLDYGDYYVDTEDYSLTYKANTAVGEVVILTFSADYVDARRTPQQTQHFEWSRSLSCITETPTNINVDIDVPSKYSLSPFKNRGEFNVNAKVTNGSATLDDSLCTFCWKFFDTETKEWAPIADNEEELPWYVSGADTSALRIDQDYIGRIRLMCDVTVKDIDGTYSSPATLLRRWYGQYDESLDIIQGKYIYDDTTQAQAEVVVENRQGAIANPCQYFDISIYYPNADGLMECISNTTTAIVDKSALNDSTHAFGMAVRELTEFQPIELEDGSVLCDADGVPLFAQFPTVEIEQ